MAISQPCNFCGSKRCARIRYGRTVETPQLREAIAAGQVVLGGCIYAEGLPQWRCLDCGQEWPADNEPKRSSQ